MLSIATLSTQSQYKSIWRNKTRQAPRNGGMSQVLSGWFGSDHFPIFPAPSISSAVLSIGRSPRCSGLFLRSQATYTRSETFDARLLCLWGVLGVHRERDGGRYWATSRSRSTIVVFGEKSRDNARLTEVSVSSLRPLCLARVVHSASGRWTR